MTHDNNQCETLNIPPDSNRTSDQVLLNHGANTDLETEEGWSIVQESISSGSIELADKTLEARNRVR